MARKPIDCKLRLDGMPVRSETVLTEAGPNVLVLSTTLRDRGIYVAMRRGNIRISPHLYNVPAEIDATLEVLAKV